MSAGNDLDRHPGRRHYYAQLVEEESTATVMAALRAVVERQGLFCASPAFGVSQKWLPRSLYKAVDSTTLAS